MTGNEQVKPQCFGENRLAVQKQAKPEVMLIWNPNYPKGTVVMTFELKTQV